MAYVTAEARQELLQEIASAIDRLSSALAATGAAYEVLDEQAADRLEAELFRPLQVAYGRAQRTHSTFAARHGIPGRAFRPAVASDAAPGQAAERLDAAVEAIEDADAILVDLQDSMRPVEVGDAELRAGLAEVRRLLDPLPERTRRLQSVLGR